MSLFLRGIIKRCKAGWRRKGSSMLFFSSYSQGLHSQGSLRRKPLWRRDSIYQDTLVPEVFLIFHRISRSCERAAKRRPRVAKRRERKTSGYFGLESHFHEDLTLELGLVDIFTNTQINTIGLFNWQYRGDGGDICYWTYCVHITTREILQFLVYIK